jgi:hypothetical protein
MPPSNSTTLALGAAATLAGLAALGANQVAGAQNDEGDEPETPPNSRTAAISRPIAWESVSLWPVRSFPQYHSSAHFMALGELADGVTLPEDTVGRVRSRAWAVGDLEAARPQAEENLRAFVPRYAEVVGSGRP